MICPKCLEKQRDCTCQLAEKLAAAPRADTTPLSVCLEKKGDSSIIAVVALYGVDHEFDVTVQAYITVAALLQANGGSADVSIKLKAKGKRPEKSVTFRLTAEIVS